METFIMILAYVCGIGGAIAAVKYLKQKKENPGCMAQGGVAFGTWFVIMIVFTFINDAVKSPEQRAKEQAEADSIANVEKMQQEEQARQDSIAQFQKEQQELINEIERTAIHAIKDCMNDDDSFELVDENIAVQDKYWEVWIKFRGTNVRGAKVLNECTVKIDKETKQVISMEALQ